MNKLVHNEWKELILKCWVTHDAMWFMHCLNAFGIARTNELNRAAVKSMAMIEAKRLKKALHIGEINQLDDLKKFIDKGFEIFQADFMKFKKSYPSENILRWGIGECFAYSGVKKLGAIDKYKCVIYERLASWFDVLKIRYTVMPTIDGCTRHAANTDSCFF